MKKMLVAAAFGCAMAACAHPGGDKRADHVFVNGAIYVADAGRTIAGAMAIGDGEILFTGDEAGARALAGAETTIVDLGGRLVLPGLHDSHLHPISAMPIETCSLENRPRPLAEISAEAAACIARIGAAAGTPVGIDLWNYAAGNQPDERLQTIRQALDAASAAHPILLFGSDGHHYGANSAALARARNARGERVGLSAATLASDFSALAPYVGVDRAGEPNGRLTETYALEAISADEWAAADIERRRAAPDLLTAVTAPRGITSFLDAAADPETLDIYDALEKSGKLHARATLALYFDPTAARARGDVDFSTTMAKAAAIREKYKNAPHIKATFLKLFADGVMEGDPLSTPPTLPNAALSRDYLQPIYEWDDEAAWVRVKGYVDPASAPCAVRNLDAAAFQKRYGFHPAQCARSAGTLQHDEQTTLDYIKAGDAAGFTFNIHAIGDRAVKTALDGIALAGRDGGRRRHIITHLQLTRPEDRARFAPLGVYASMTFAWAVIDPQYDTTVFPFIDRATPESLYDPDGYYYRNAYAAASLMRAGATIIAGSDAPVDTIDPRPFVNIEGAVSRAIADNPPFNSAEAITIEDAIDAYTINGARALQQDELTGSLEKGKRADFIVLDQNIIALAKSGAASRISETKVLETWFDGEKVFERPAE
ncbi:MAG TPA: amidohydrolase [Parvularcula sp.]|nr:amidohydrolase [Parvularcula sp.]